MKISYYETEDVKEVGYKKVIKKANHTSKVS